MFEVPRTNPGNGGSITASDPGAACMIDLLGGSNFFGVGFSNDQTRALARIYEFDLGNHDNAMMEAGIHRNLMRVVQRDGLRLMGIMSRLAVNGEDPVKLLVSMAIDHGFDMAGLVDWCEEEDDDD